MVDLAMKGEVQQFLSDELLSHAETLGFAFLLDQETLLTKIIDQFSLSRSDALWHITLFIQENAGPEGDLAIIEKPEGRFFQWRYVKWPSWLPKYVKKPRWHRKPLERPRSYEY
ncbi:MAG TPA: hypothetical protein VM050_08015 [Patescibacteria group bacterium]|nr:hypothetical protein [Patescibacteria group bacterium]